MKKLFRGLILNAVILSILFTNQSISYAATQDTKEEALKAYEDILVNNPYADMDGGFTSEEFNIMDITGDDIPELIINEEAPQIFTYINGKTVWMYNSYVYCSLYYSKKSNNFMFYMNFDKVKSYQIFKYTDIENFKTEDIVQLSYKNNKYYQYDTNKEKDKVISKKTYKKLMKKYMPDYIKLETPYKNTEENRQKYIK